MALSAKGENRVVACAAILLEHEDEYAVNCVDTSPACSDDIKVRRGPRSPHIWGLRVYDFWLWRSGHVNICYSLNLTKPGVGTARAIHSDRNPK